MQPDQNSSPAASSAPRLPESPQSVKDQMTGDATDGLEVREAPAASQVGMNETTPPVTTQQSAREPSQPSQPLTNPREELSVIPSSDPKTASQHSSGEIQPAQPPQPSDASNTNQIGQHPASVKKPPKTRSTAPVITIIIASVVFLGLVGLAYMAYAGS